jgi:hypothetical protein
MKFHALLLCLLPLVSLAQAPISINSLPAASTITGTEAFPCEQGGTKKCTPSQVATYTGTQLAPSATIDTTNASNITSGTLNGARLPGVPITQLIGNLAFFYPSYPLTLASIGAAATLAYSSGGGTVQLPAGNYTFTAPICGPANTGAPTVCYPGVTYSGAGYGFGLINGTFTPFGTVLSFSGGNDGFDYNNIDCNGANCPAPPVSNTALLSAMIQGFGVTNLTIQNCVNGIKIGALYNPGMFGGTIANVTMLNCSGWGLFLENFFHTDVHNIYSTGNTTGQIWLGSSGAAINQFGNSKFYNLTGGAFSGSGAVTQRGIVVEARGTSGTFNQMIIDTINAEFGGRVAQTQAATMSNGSPNIGVTNSAAYIRDQPVSFSASVNGVTAGVVYFVLTSASNVLTISNLQGGSPISMTGSTAVNIASYGFAPLEVIGNQEVGVGSHADVMNSAFTNLDLETPTGVNSSMLVAQQVRDTTFTFNYISPGSDSTIVHRASSATYFPLDSATPVTYDIDTGFANPFITGTRYTVATTGATSWIGVGFSQLSIDSTDTRCASAGQSSSLAGGGLLYISGLYTADECFNKNSWFLDLQNFPIGFKSSQLTNGQTINGAPSTRTTSNVVCPVSGSNGVTLPAINSNGEGLIVWISNPSSGTCTVSAQSGINIVGFGASANTYVLAALTNGMFWSINAGGTLQWSVR